MKIEIEREEDGRCRLSFADKVKQGQRITLEFLNHPNGGIALREQRIHSPRKRVAYEHGLRCDVSLYACSDEDCRPFGRSDLPDTRPRQHPHVYAFCVRCPVWLSKTVC